ncbi:MAG TPA: patatin-like phospholipase family protein [Candidatus Acidoferrales bacterium]|jgi:NTE family protein|nr:patatin-like phospholipase family protein [Candidatus Acidoferrales bacterium]
MASEKNGDPQNFLRMARDVFRSFAYGGSPKGTRRPRVGIALAGGFARGIAHIGVLRVLREAGIPVDVVSGTSVGALIATAYCAGAPLEMMQRIAHETKFTDFGRWTPSWLGLATNNRLEDFIARFTTIKRFEELQKPLAIATTDINLGLPVYYHGGPLAPPLRASCAYPGLFVPVKYEGRTLVDGFLTALVPIEGTLLLGAEIVIAVYLEAGAVDEPRTFTDVLSRSFTIIQKHADLEWRKEADIIIEPDVTPFLWDDFSKTSELVRAGEEATLKALPAIRAALESKSVPDSDFEEPEAHTL